MWLIMWLFLVNIFHTGTGNTTFSKQETIEPGPYRKELTDIRFHCIQSYLIITACFLILIAHIYIFDNTPFLLVAL